MFARYQDILAGQVDEDGMGINAVGKALERVGINIRDVDGGFRDFSDILDELYPKWDSLNEVEQANITKALAGVRQRESLLILLENQAKYEKALEIQMDSSGLAADRYATYLDSVEAAQNRLTASWEKLVMGTATGDMIANFYDGVTAVLEFVDSLGGIPTILSVIIPLMVIYNAELLKTNYLSFSAGVVSAGKSLLSFGKSLQAAISLLTAGNSVTSVMTVSMGAAATAVTAVALAVGALVAVVYTYNEEVTKTQEAGLEQSSQVWSDIFSTITSQGGDAVDVLSRYQEGINAINKSHQEAGIIADLFVDKQKMIDEGLQETINALGETTSSYYDYISSVEKALEMAGYHVNEEGKVYREIQTSRGAVRQYIDDLEILSKAQWNNGEALNMTKDDAIIPSTEAVNDLSQAYTGLVDTIAKLSSGSDAINSLFEKSVTEGLDISDISKIPEEYLSALTVEGNKLKLNIDLIRQKQLAEAEMSYQAVKQAYERGEATSQEVDVIRFYYEQLLDTQYRMVDGVRVTQGAFSELAWSIAQNAAMSGNSFVDLQGNALNSIEAIYSYLMSGDQAFNDFVRQAANITGMSVQEIMGQINSMLSQVVSNAANAINFAAEAASYVANFDSPTGYGAPPATVSARGVISPTSNIFKPAPVGYQYAGGLSDYSKSGGGGSSGLEEERNLENEIKSIEEDIEEARRNGIDSLQEQLDVYKDIIDARKQLLDTMADERQYQQDVEDKNKEILKVQNELAILRLDDSEAANARRLALEDELSNLSRDLENIHYEESVEDQKDALDAEYSSFEKKILMAIKQVEGIQATSLSEFASKLSSILSSIGGVPEYHNGVEAGIVGKNKINMKSNELYAKLLEGEIVSTPSQADNFIRNSLPQLVESASNIYGGSVDLNMPITVQGNMDKTVIPEMDKIADKILSKIQEIMNQRGYNRRSDLFQI